MTATLTIPKDDSLIYYNGRWDSEHASWWAGTGLKLNIQNLTFLSLTLGPNTTAPHTNLGVSIDYGPYFQLQVRQGENEVPLGAISGKSGSNTVVRLVAQGWENNRVVLENIKVNEDAKLLPYIPQKLVIQFIGDSHCSGQYFKEGINQAWTFLVGERLKAETRINAQPGIALTDVESWGNRHGQIFQFFQTEDPGYAKSLHHNYTSPWNFEKDAPPPNVVVVHLGANDRGQKVPPEVFLQSLKDFLAHLREVYSEQPILVFTPWGWPQPDGSNDLYYRKEYDEAYEFRRAAGDTNLHLIDGDGWLIFEDFDPENVHPTVAGDQKIAGLFVEWLERFGIHPDEKWATVVDA